MKSLKINCCFLILVGSFFSSIAQVGINTDDPDSRVVLEIHDPNRGILFPSIGNGQMELLEKNTPHGTFVFDPKYQQYFMYNSNNNTGVNQSKWDIINPWKMQGAYTGNNPNDLTIRYVGNVGIGTNNPGHKLEVNGDIFADDIYSVNKIGIGTAFPTHHLDLNQKNSDGGIRIRLSGSSAAMMEMGYLGSGSGFIFNAKAGGDQYAWNRFHFQSEGNDVMIIRDTKIEVFQPLDVNGVLSANSISSWGSIFAEDIRAWKGFEAQTVISHGELTALSARVWNDLTVGGDIILTGDVIDPSDRTIKQDIETLSNCLDKINQLSAYTYRWNDLASKQNEGDEKQIGVMAQEVELVFPELVGQSDDGYKYVRYNHLVAPLIEAVKELTEQGKDKDQKIEELTRRLELLEELLRQ